MVLDEHLPQTKVGSSYNSIYLENALVERICVSYGEPMTLNFSLDVDLIEWLFLVGIYKSKDKYYLLLEANGYSSTIDMMIEDGLCFNTGFILISESIAFELTEKISKLGKEYFTMEIPQYYRLIDAIVLSMECKVVFTTLLNREGYYNKNNKEIVVGNNNSQFTMIWTLVHECVHYMLNSERNSPSTCLEYLFDNEENVCNTVAFEIMEHFLGIDVMASIEASVLFKLLKEKNACTNMQEYSPEEIVILRHFMGKNTEKNKEMQETIVSIRDRILNGIEAAFDKNSETIIDCAQTGLVILSPIDNQSLYDIVINEISHMFPYEDC